MQQCLLYTNQLLQITALGSQLYLYPPVLNSFLNTGKLNYMYSTDNTALSNGHIQVCYVGSIVIQQCTLYGIDHHPRCLPYRLEAAAFKMAKTHWLPGVTIIVALCRTRQNYEYIRNPQMQKHWPVSALTTKPSYISTYIPPSTIFCYGLTASQLSLCMPMSFSSLMAVLGNI